MISNQVLQTTLDGLKAISRVDLCVLDTEGIMLATTFPEAEGFRDSVLSFAESPADSQVVSGCQFFKVFDEHQLEYVLLANGNSDDVSYGREEWRRSRSRIFWWPIRSASIRTTLSRTCFLDNLLLVDIYNRAKKLHIDIGSTSCGIYTWRLSHEKDNGVPGDGEEDCLRTKTR